MKSVQENIIKVAELLGVDAAWCLAIAEIESSMGINQKSHTGCLGIYQMSLIAMKDLLQEMGKKDGDDMIDIVCGIAFLRLLLKRHGSIEAATAKFCDPKDRGFYVPKVMGLITKYQGTKKYCV